LIRLSFFSITKFAVVISFALGRTGLRRQNAILIMMSAGRPLSSNPWNFLGECVCDLGLAVIPHWTDRQIGEEEGAQDRQQRTSFALSLFR